jgi:hypothetical protein
VRILRRYLPVFESELLARQHTLAALVTFVKTLEHNLHSHPTGIDHHFHRVAWRGSFSRNDVAKLNLWMGRQGQDFLESADSWMGRQQQLSKKRSLDSEKKVRVSIGVYLAVDDAANK